MRDSGAFLEARLMHLSQAQDDYYVLPWPRIHIHLTAPNHSIEQDVFEIDVASDFTLADLKGYIQAETTFEPSKQRLYFDGRPLTGDQTTIQSANIKDGDMLAVMVMPDQEQGRTARSQASTSQTASDAAAANIERQRNTWLNNPAQLAQVQSQTPEIAEAIHDPAEFRRRFEARLEAERRNMEERERQLQQLNDDPMDIENQKKIEEIIRQHNVTANLEYAHEHNPESFAPVTMLYINASINGHDIKVLVDSGAQMTVMSPATAEACNIMRLIDTRYAGIARGVGTAKILGRVHSADLHIGSHFLPCSFNVMEGKAVDLLLGLDMLKKYQVCIDLKKNRLVLPDEEIEFLPESEIPKAMEEERAAEPTIPGPNGTEIGTETGVIRPSGSTAQPSKSGTNSRDPGQTAVPLPADLRQTPAAPSPSSSQQQQAGAPEQQSFPDESIAALIGMGFSRDKALEALRVTDGNVDLAASFLFD
ncbi:hypothetical protein CAC42_6439 [Sphaceloma murrayae]|uniref:DNA damage-inducible protein 1 n=1 Tax=Sphaceloma murrayae TaxID=2082308 RepID=A0A2K1QMX6_9PEZI|nr:hypothetical protein CAC42_6439 [Sphaceloma murrayae]